MRMWVGFKIFPVWVVWLYVRLFVCGLVVCLVSWLVCRIMEYVIHVRDAVYIFYIIFQIPFSIGSSFADNNPYFRDIRIPVTAGLFLLSNWVGWLMGGCETTEQRLPKGDFVHERTIIHPLNSTTFMLFIMKTYNITIAYPYTIPYCTFMIFSERMKNGKLLLRICEMGKCNTFFIVWIHFQWQWRVSESDGKWKNQMESKMWWLMMMVMMGGGCLLENVALERMNILK